MPFYFWGIDGTYILVIIALLISLLAVTGVTGVNI